MRFIFIILGYVAGFFGIGIGLFIYICILTSLKSFGVPYMAPYTPVTNIKQNGYFLEPVWKREKRGERKKKEEGRRLRF